MIVDLENAPTEEDFEELESHLNIDPRNLQKALLNRVKYMETVCECANFFRKQDAIAKQAAKRKAAEINLRIRQESEKKPSEECIKAMVLVHEEVLAAEEAAIVAEHHKNRWMDLRNNFDAQGKDLETLASLIRAGYSVV